MACDDPLVVIATSTSSTTRPRSGNRGSDFVLWHSTANATLNHLMAGFE